MYKKILLILTIILFIKFPTQSYNNNNTNMKTNTIKTSSETIGYIKISKINLHQSLYNINSKHNNVDENVTILKESIFPGEEKSTMYLAAHSGDSKVSFFNNINKLTKNDIITIKIDNAIYYYKVNKLWEQKKNGYIKVTTNWQKKLFLTTCSTTNSTKQLIIESILYKKK